MSEPLYAEKKKVFQSGQPFGLLHLKTTLRDLHILFL